MSAVLRAHTHAEPGQARRDSALPLRVVPPDDLIATSPPPVRFVFEPIIPRAEVTMMSGHGGAGKSTLGLTLAAHHACGARWNGLCCVSGRALFVSLEDSADLVRWRLRAICAAYALDERRVAENVTIADGTEADDAALAREQRGHDGATTVKPTAAMSQLAGLAAGTSLIVIDNASDAADLDEINRQRVRAFMRMLKRIARDADAAVLLLAHIDKQAATHGRAGNTFSGSTAWHNSARSRLALIESNGALELSHEKANLSAKAPSMRLRFVDHGVLMPYDHTLSETVDETGHADADTVLAALHAAQAAGCNVSSSRTGAKTGYSVLKTFGLPEPLRRDRDRFWRALNLLLADGRAASAEYKTPDHKTRNRIVAIPPNRPSAKPPTPPANSAGRTADPLNATNDDFAAIERFGGTVTKA
jgi:RecA-family ATPase